MLERKMTYKTKFGTAYLDKRGYYKISSSKEGNRNKNLHRLIYEDCHKVTLLDGVHVHHKDGNKTNNDISNLEAVTIAEHNKIHKTGENNYFYSKHLTDEHKMKISKANKGKVFSQTHKQNISKAMTKNYSRIIKASFTRNGKRRYVIVKDGKRIKSSINPSKLLGWFAETYPNEILVLGE